MVFSFADALAVRGVPFMFLTGYEQAVIPTRHADVPRYEKPFNYAAVMRALAHLLIQREAKAEGDQQAHTLPVGALPSDNENVLPTAGCAASAAGEEPSTPR
jgi:hypothetical protein